MSTHPIIITDEQWVQVTELAKLHCTAVEIASFLSLSPRTLDRRCRDKYGVTLAEFLKSGAAIGNISLRRAQFKKAMSGDPSMLKWLGKNMLNQTDKTEITSTIEVKSITDMLTESEAQKVINAKEVEVIDLDRPAMPEPEE